MTNIKPSVSTTLDRRPFTRMLPQLTHESEEQKKQLKTSSEPKQKEPDISSQPNKDDFINPLDSSYLFSEKVRKT